MGWPKYLRKTYTKEELEKKVLKKLQMPHDREFLKALFISEKRGEWHLKAQLDKEEKKRLKKIVKEIKKGRGGVKVLPLVILLILIAGAVVFSLFFKNPLAERLLVSSLESLFGATVDVEGVSLTLVPPEFRWDRIAVTDADDLDTNLFEVGETIIGLNGRALLERKVVIDNLVSLDARWGTPRERAGKLVVSEPREGGDGNNASGTAGEEEERSSLFSPENFETEQTDLIVQAASDPRAFVDEQWDSLKTPALAEELSDKYKSELDTRKTSQNTLRGESKTVVSGGQDFLARDFSRYKSHPDEIPALVNEANDYYGEVNDLKDDLDNELKAINRLRRSILEDKDALNAARKEDMDRVKSLIVMPEGGIRGMVDGMVRSYLYSLLGDKFLKAEKIARFIKRYREEGEDKNGEGNRPGRHGRVVSFAAVSWPDFLLRNAAVSASGGGLTWDASLNDLAGDPEQWDEPVATHLIIDRGDGSLEGDGTWERRENVENPSQGDFVFTGLPMETEALGRLGICHAEGQTDGTAELTVIRDGSWEFAADVTVKEPALEKSGDDMVANVVYRVLAGEDWDISLTASGEGSDMDMKLDWPLLDRVDDEIGAQLKEQADAYLADVQEELLGRYGEEAAFLDDYLGDLDDWESLLKGDLSSLDKTKNDMDAKVEETKKEVADQAQEEVGKVLEETGLGDKLDDVQNSLPFKF